MTVYAVRTYVRAVYSSVTLTIKRKYLNIYQYLYNECYHCYVKQRTAANLDMRVSMIYGKVNTVLLLLPYVQYRTVAQKIKPYLNTYLMLQDTMGIHTHSTDIFVSDIDLVKLWPSCNTKYILFLSNCHFTYVLCPYYEKGLNLLGICQNERKREREVELAISLLPF